MKTIIPALFLCIISFIASAQITGSHTVCVTGTTVLSPTTGGGEWSSSDKKVATVNEETGVVTGVVPGPVTILYTIKDAVPQQHQMTVNLMPTLTGTDRVCMSATSTLTGDPLGGNYSTSVPLTAAINATGVVTPVATGTTIIGYNVAGCTASRTVTVIPAISMIAAPGAGNVCLGSTTTLTCTPTGGTWSSGTPANATVDSKTGVVTGLTVGTSRIDYRVEGCGTATPHTITVNAKTDSITGNMYTYTGNSTTLTSTTSGKWSSGNPAIATVSPATATTTATVTGLKSGIVTINLEVNGCRASASVIVDAPPGSFEQQLKEILSSDEFSKTIADRVGNISFVEGKATATKYDKYAYDRYLDTVRGCSLCLFNCRRIRIGRYKDSMRAINPRWQPAKPLGVSVTIDTLGLNFANGRIDYAILQANDGRIYDNRNLAYNVINIRNIRNTRFNSRRNFERKIALSETQLMNRDWDTCMILDDIIQYKPRLRRNHYYPDDKDITLVPIASPSVQLYKNVDLNNCVDFRIYSDVLGLLKKQNNGIIQSDLKAKIFLNTYQKGKFCFLNYLAPSVTYSKYDEKFNSLIVNDTIQPLFLTDSQRVVLYQLSYLNLGIKGNLFKVPFANNFTEINAGVDFNFSNIKLNNTKGEIKTYTSWSWHAEWAGEVKPNDNFGITYSIKYLFQNTVSTDMQVFGYTDTYFIPEIGAFYYTNESYTNKLFLKFRMTNHDKSFSGPITTSNFNAVPINIYDVKRAFFAFQIGYNARLKFNK